MAGETRSGQDRVTACGRQVRLGMRTARVRRATARSTRAIPLTSTVKLCLNAFGDPRVMALLQALTGFIHLRHGFRNRDLRPQVEALLGLPYSAAQMTYDLRRLQLKGVIHRIPKTHRYTATSYGLKVAFFYSKLYLRILRPEWTALLPENDHLPRTLRTALDQLDDAIQKLPEEASLLPEKLASTVTMSPLEDV